MKVGFIYYSFFPVSGGASVHGFNLAKGLTKLGYDLYKINGEPDPFTHKLKNRITGLIWMLKNCDLMYIRMDFFFNFRNLITLIALLFRKKVIVELNSPADELHVFGRSKNYIKRADKVMGFILRKVDAVIVINDIVKKYGEQELGLSNVYAIDNGGEVIENISSNVSEEIIGQVQSIKEKYNKIVVWTGSANNLHDLDQLKRIAHSLENKVAVILIIRVESQELPDGSDVENLFIFENIERDDVRYIVANSDVGLTFYSSFDWSRWGYYGSSTKTYEYLNNGLLTIANISGTKQQQKYPNFKKVDTFEEIILSIQSYSKKSIDLSSCLRTWQDVADETSDIFKKVIEYQDS